MLYALFSEMRKKADNNPYPTRVYNSLEVDRAGHVDVYIEERRALVDR